MKRRIVPVLIALPILAALWLFVGVERVVGDHEIGVTWEPFIKHHSDPRVFFENPAQHGLDIVPYEELSPAEQQRFVDYCNLRFGVSDPNQCHEALRARQV